MHSFNFAVEAGDLRPCRTIQVVLRDLNKRRYKFELEGFVWTKQRSKYHVIIVIYMPLFELCVVIPGMSGRPLETSHGEAG